jgi:hypothetical protein
MFSLKFDVLFAAVAEAKHIAKSMASRRRRLQINDADFRERQRMLAEIKAAREHARLMDILNRNRIF